MALAAFQRALCELIASPELCLAVRENADAVLARYELSGRERQRLAAIVWQPGMSTTCSLYRANRITPIYTRLPFTCFLLAGIFAREVTLYWTSRPSTDLQYGPEIEQFAEFLRSRLRAGAIDDPVLEDVLDFEVAANALDLVPRRQVLRDLSVAMRPGPDRRYRLHPLIRIRRFRHEPAELLARLAKQDPPPYDLPAGEFFVFLSVSNGALEVAILVPDLGRRLFALQAGTWQPSVAECPMLLAAGLIIDGWTDGEVTIKRDETATSSR